jgi:hypothetical protein
MYTEMQLGGLRERQLDKLVQELVLQEQPGAEDREKCRMSWERGKWWRRLLPRHRYMEYCRSHEGMGLVIEKLGMRGYTVMIEPRGENIRILSREGKETVCTLRRYALDIRRAVAVAAVLAVQGE